MPATLRIQTEKVLKVSTRHLDAEVGCGLMLARIPRYRPNDVFRDVMRGYQFPELYADATAAGILERDERDMRQFCLNAEDKRLPLKPNFRTVYAPRDACLALDVNQKSAYFLAVPAHRLALVNYYRDVLPQIARELGLTIGGSPLRLTPLGWQNLHDTVTNPEFSLDCPGVARINVTADIPAARWTPPVLEIAVFPLNFSDPVAIRAAIVKEVKRRSPAPS